MKDENEKKGLLERLTGKKKKKGSCCCNVEIEEISEENIDKEEKTPKKGKDCSCCK